MKTIMSQLSQLIVALLMVGVVSEVGMRVYLWHIADDTFFSYYASLRQLDARAAPGEEAIPWFFELDRYVGYRNAPNPSPNRFDHNNLGFRGEDITVAKPDGMFRIIVLGSSLVFDPHLSLEESYPYRLEQTLRATGYNVEIINAGGANYTTLESLTLLGTAIFELDPDLILIYHGRSDIHHRLVWPPEAYRGNYSGSHNVNVALQFTPPTYEFSTFVRMIGIRAGWVESHSKRFDTTIFYTPDTANHDTYRFQYLAGTYPSGIFAEVPAEDMLAANPPIYFEANLRSMVGMALANNVTPILMTQALYSNYSVNEYPRAATDVYITASEQHNTIVREVASALDVPLFDFAAAMPLEAAFFTDGSHFTAQGNVDRVDLVAQYLVTSGLLPSLEN